MGFSVHSVALFASLLVVELALVVSGNLFLLSIVVTASVFVMGTRADFETLAKKYEDAGHPAGPSGSVVGASGVSHSFAFVVSSTTGGVDVVSDTALSVSEVDETKVLGFFAKVYDVKPRAAVLCVSPRLNPGAADLARQYGLTVIENDKPRELVGMLGKTIDKILGL
ncbi:MAG: hypothetical protein HY247_03140 [archaeon]|nr:MAG: hypothetical protein HY247_03140 [archaeon]